MKESPAIQPASGMLAVLRRYAGGPDRRSTVDRRKPAEPSASPAPPPMEPAASQVILIADDPPYAAFLRSALDEFGISCLAAANVSQAMRSLASRVPPLLLVDAALPDGSGLKFCAQLRRDPRFSRAWIVLLTRRRKAAGLRDWYDAGADACWVKERGAKRVGTLVAAILRRREWETAALLGDVQGIRLDPVERKARYHGQTSAALSPREMMFLRLLMNCYPSRLPLESIGETLYPGNPAEDIPQLFSSFLSRLRRKLPKSLAGALHATKKAGCALALAKPRPARGAH